ncbi:MAG TPA: hypothetical protein VG123_05955 [Streptosporangiaceae bacterium]|nr:hypothetical protein [Streptosporangiaceae bacterium]
MPTAGPRLARRLLPVLATVALLVIGMGGTTWWGPAMIGRTAWSLPHDLWGTLIAASRLVHLDLGGLYTQPTGLITLPGAAVILAPAAAIIDAAGLSLQIPGPHNAQPSAWLVAGPYQIAVSAVVLFAADAIAEQLGLTRWRRAVLTAAEAMALWNVSVQWGHPEDAVAVGLLLYAILALSRSKTARSAWLLGAAVAIQPLVLLALPFLAVVIEPRRLAGYLARAAAPAAVLLAAAAAANWSATFSAVTSQPNWLTVDHPTAWTYLAPQLPGGGVAAGPARVLTILVACGCALVAGRRWRAARQAGRWSTATLTELLWWAALGLALRSLFEPVMVAYYLWPPLALVLIPAAANWLSLITTSVIAGLLTFGSQVSWRGPWSWWVPMVTGLGLALLAARLPLRRKDPASRALTR